MLRAHSEGDFLALFFLAGKFSGLDAAIALACDLDCESYMLKAIPDGVGDPVITDAIRDRLEHAALTICITGESYRGVNARKLAAKKRDA